LARSRVLGARRSPRSRVGRDQRLRGVEQSLNRHLVSRLGASRPAVRRPRPAARSFEQDSCAWRSSARRAVTGTLERTASRVMSCQNASLSPRSTSRSASRSSPTGRGDPKPAAQGAGELLEGEGSPERGGHSDRVARLVGEPPRRSRIFSCTRRGRPPRVQQRVTVNDVNPLLVLKPEQRLDERNGLPSLRELLEDAVRAARGACPPLRVRPPRVEWPESDRRCATSCLICSSMATSGRRLARRRSAITQAIGTPMRRIASERIAAIVPLSPIGRRRLRSGSGVSSAAPEELLQVAQSQKRFRAARASCAAARGRAADHPTNSASSKRRVPPSSRSDRRRYDRHERRDCEPTSVTSSRRRLLPITGGALDDDCDLVAFRERSSSSRISARSGSRPWSSRTGSSTSAPRAEHIQALSNRRIVRCAPARRARTIAFAMEAKEACKERSPTSSWSMAPGPTDPPGAA